MTVDEILAQADTNTKATLAALFDAIQAIHDACTLQQNEVEKVDERDAFQAIEASPPADVPATLAACAQLIANVNAKHAALLEAKAETLAQLKAKLA